MVKKRFESITTKQMLNRVREERMPFDWSINPYRGCTHGCSFCYARAFQSFIGLGAEDEFQNHILLKQNAAEALELQLSKIAKRTGVDGVGRYIGLAAIGTATDPYQPIEGKEQLTRACLKVLARYQVPVTITTRSPLVLRDLDLLTELPVASVNISVNTLDVSVTRSLEPATPFPMKRLETVQALEQHGIRAGIFIAPILPLLTDSREQLDALMAAAKNHGASFAMTSLLRLSPDVKAWYFQTLQKHYPDLVPAYAKLFSGGAYAHKAYTDSVKKMATELQQTYGLAGDVPKQPAPNACPSAALYTIIKDGSPHFAKEPVIEQLTFDF